MTAIGISRSLGRTVFRYTKARSVNHGIRPKSIRDGVTLIETVMVIIILAAAAVGSSFLLDGQWTARRGVTSVTHDVANTLRLARNTAITNQSTVRVERQRRAGAEQLVIHEDAGPFRPAKSWTVELGNDARLLGSPRRIVFSPTGTADRNLTWQITRSRTSGQVTVSPTSGRVSRTLP